MCTKDHQLDACQAGPTGLWFEQRAKNDGKALCANGEMGRGGWLLEKS